MSAFLLPAALSATGSVVGGLLGSSGAKDQIKQMQAAIAYQKEKDAQTRADLAPYREFGGEQLNSLNSWLKDPTQDPMSMLDPGYAFRRDQGMKNLTGNAATAGLLQSGDTLRGIEKYGQDMSSQEYNNAFNRWLQKGQYKQGLAGMGEEAALGGAALANTGAANVGRLTAETDWGAPKNVWADVASGIGGMGGNMLARRLSQPTAAPIPGGSNIFADPNSYGTPGMNYGFNTSRPVASDAYNA